MNPHTFTSDLLLDLDESMVTDALATIGSEYIKLPVKSPPAERTRAVLLYFDEWLRTYVLEQVGHPGPRVHPDCRRTDVPEWLVTGDGPEVVAGLLAHERTVVDDGPVEVDGTLDPAQIRSITPERVQGVQFWGHVELDLADTAMRGHTPSGPEEGTRLRVPGTVTVDFTLVDVAAPTVVLGIEIAPDRSVTFRVGDLFWGRWLDGDRRLTDRIETVLDTERFRGNFQDTVQWQFDGDLQLELTGSFPVDVADYVSADKQRGGGP